jgi:probable HAF family extracellular repeat protein
MSRFTYGAARLCTLAAVVSSVACRDNLPSSPDPSRPAASVLSSGVAASEPLLLDLGPLAGPTSDATAVNDAGQVVGHSWLGYDPGWHGFVWTAPGSVVDVGQYHFVLDVNAHGAVAGRTLGGGLGAAGAFVWSPTAGSETVVLNAAYPFASAQALNDAGQMAGWYQKELSPGGLVGDYSFVWSPSAGFQAIGSLGGDFTQAYGINDQGKVVGYASTCTYASGRACPYHAFLWTPGIGMRDLGDLGGPWSMARDVNESDAVVGGSYTADGRRRAFRWTPTGGMQSLGTLGGDASDAFAVNDLGHVVGWSVTTAQDTVAFYWTEQTGMIPLEKPIGADFAMALGLNNRGQVVGRVGLGTVFSPVASQYRAVMWDVTLPPPNRAPTLTLGGPYAAQEGAAIPLGWNSADLDGDALTYTWDFGNGVTGSGPALPTSYAYPDNLPGEGPFAITVTASDGKGGLATAQAEAAISNAAPTITGLSGPFGAPIPVALPVTMSGTFADPGSADTHHAAIRWDAGAAFAPLDALAAGTRSFSVTTTALRAGVYTIAASVVDDDGGNDLREVITDFVVVYDPSAGFVTGGGWIASPAGACRYGACEDGTVGKATFGFVSRYRQGATAPEGDTEFQFAAGRLRFSSDAYQWLVVSGARAQYKGAGKVNGAGDYGFLVTAVDGALLPSGPGADRFRIKIWDRATGAVMYDNQMGEGEDSDASTTLGGGSIVIHR